MAVRGADSVVLAMGSFSTQLVKPLGIDLMLYPGKGYSATYRVLDPALTPRVSLTDDGHKLVISRLGDRLRVAGTCEINGYSRELNPVRCQAITKVSAMASSASPRSRVRVRQNEKTRSL